MQRPQGWVVEWPLGRQGQIVAPRSGAVPPCAWHRAPRVAVLRRLTLGACRLGIAAWFACAWSIIPRELSSGRWMHLDERYFRT